MENLSPSNRKVWPLYQISVVIITSLYLLTFHVSPTIAQDQLLQNCSKSQSDCVAGLNWFNPETRCCVRCSTCDFGGTEMFTKQQCNVTHDAVCACHDPLYFDKVEGHCLINCHKCETRMCMINTERCICPGDPSCYQEHDLYCRSGPVLCTREVVTEPSTRMMLDVIHERETSLPPWGIGLIAIGVVIGIIIFASCFLCLGIFTITKNKDPESQGSDNSENGLVRASVNTAVTENSYLSSGYPYLNSHSMLELLKNSNSQFLLHTGSGNSAGISGGMSSLTSSPVSIRGSPRPIRTIKLVKNSDKISAVVL